MPVQSIGHAVPMWFLRSALLASALTIGLDVSGAIAVGRQQSILVWLIAMVAFVLCKALWWSWRMLAHRHGNAQ